MIEYITCKQEAATHVRIVDEDLKGTELTFGKVYEYCYDSNPSEETHYVILDNGIPFYDFECVISVEYLKELK